MKTRKAITCMRGAVLAAVLAGTSIHANAGIWETITSFFSDSPEVAAPEQSSAAQPSLTDTGIALAPLIAQQLGIDLHQATGGLGAILQAAQVLMPGTDFSKVTRVIPNSNSLMASAPSVNQGSGLVASALSAVGEHSETAKTGLQLVSQFKALGMNPNMIGEFANVTSGFLKESEQPATGDAFSQAFSAITY